jgi:hypothetical protein
MPVWYSLLLTFTNSMVGEPPSAAGGATASPASALQTAT